MVSASKLSNVLWWSFFVYYTVYKYLASLQYWDPEFGVQVAFLSMMTAFAPYYAMRFLLRSRTGSARLAMTLILPLLFCAIGYVVFYYTRIVPYFDGVSLQNDVMPRSIFPGVVITLLFLVEQHLIKRNSDSDAQSE